MTYHLITFRCKECGEKIKILIRDNHDLVFSILDKLHSEKQCLTEHGNFKCIICNNIDNTRKFEKVYC